MTRKYPLPGLCLTGEELAKVAREKIAGLSKEAAVELLQDVESEQGDDGDEGETFEIIPKTAEDQEAFGVGVWQGTEEASRRFNELTSGKGALEHDEAIEKIAAEIGDWDAETEALRSQLEADPDQELLIDMVQKVAEEDPQALADFAAAKLDELGYEVKVADDGEETEGDEADEGAGVEDEPEGGEGETEGGEGGDE